MERAFANLNLEGNFYSCKHCQTRFALVDDIISKVFIFHSLKLDEFDINYGFCDVFYLLIMVRVMYWGLRSWYWKVEGSMEVGVKLIYTDNVFTFNSILLTAFNSTYLFDSLVFMYMASSCSCIWNFFLLVSVLVPCCAGSIIYSVIMEIFRYRRIICLINYIVIGVMKCRFKLRHLRVH